MLSVALLALSIVAAADDARAQARRHAEELIARLASPSFKEREKAAADIVRLGSAALDALRKGSHHPDAEVGERCRKLLPQALDFHVREQIEIFLARPDGPIPEDLPGIRRWLAVAGSGKDARELYARLVKAHRKTLIDTAANPEPAAQRFQLFCREVYERANGIATAAAPAKEGVTQEDVLLFLFLGSDPNCQSATGPIKTAYAQTLPFLNSPHLRAMLSGDGATGASKKLFLAWLEKERSPIVVRRGFQAATAAGLKEAVPLALKAAGDKTLTPAFRTYPLLAAAKLIGPEHLKELTPLLEDKTVVGRVGGGADPMTTEVRDIALGVALLATGQKPADFGFERFRDQPNLAPSSYFYFALTEAKREEAHKKWREWAAQNKK
jgi:hypothetical protein